MLSVLFLPKSDKIKGQIRVKFYFVQLTPNANPYVLCSKVTI